MANNIDQEIADLDVAVAAVKNAKDSAVALIDGFSEQLAAAIQQGRDLGATDEQLAQLDALQAALHDHAASLAAAVVNVTPTP